MTQIFIDNYESTLYAAVTSASQTAIQVPTGFAAAFSAAASGVSAPFVVATLATVNAQNIFTANEKVFVTAATAGSTFDTLTVTRGQEGTAASANWPVTTQIFVGATAGTFTRLVQAIASLVPGATANIAGGAAGELVFQSGIGATSFLQLGTNLSINYSTNPPTINASGTGGSGGATFTPLTLAQIQSLGPTSNPVASTNVIYQEITSPYRLFVWNGTNVQAIQRALSPFNPNTQTIQSGTPSPLGDYLVVTVAGTLAAAVDGTPAGTALAVGDIFIQSYGAGGNVWFYQPKTGGGGSGTSATAGPSIAVVSGAVSALGARVLKPVRTATRLYPVEAMNTTAASAFGYTGTGAGASITSHQLFDVETNFDAVQLIFGNLSTTASMTIQGASVSAGANGACTAADTINAGGTYTPVTFGGNASAVIGPSTVIIGASQMPKLLLSDWIPLGSLPRSDVSGARPLLYIRAAAVPTSGSTSDPLTNLRLQTGNGGGYQTSAYGRINLSSFGNAAAPQLTGAYNGANPAIFAYNAFCLGFRYRARNGRIITVASIGDSITVGAGTSNIFSWAQKGPLLANNANAGSNSGISPYPIEHMKFGYPGQSAATYEQAFEYLRTSGLNYNVAVFSAYTPNSAGQSALTRQSLVKFLAECDDDGTYPLVWTGVPSPALLTTAALDQDRLTYNATLNSVDAGYMDFASAVSGTVTGGITQYATGDGNADNIHPNDAGDTAMAAVFQAKLQQLAVNFWGAKTV